jgi:hypothetical protein
MVRRSKGGMIMPPMATTGSPAEEKLAHGYFASSGSRNAEANAEANPPIACGRMVPKN